VLAASDFGCTPKIRTKPFAVAFSPRVIGANTRETKTSGGASRSTARSGSEKEMFFGTISPNTTCR